VKSLKLVPFKKLHLSWDFGDGSKGKGAVVKHSYRKKGSYTVTLTLKAPGGRKKTMKQVVTIEG
jgi:PKD repeat protein